MFAPSKSFLDFSKKGHVFWLLQTLGWSLMLMVVVRLVFSSRSDLLYFVFFRTVFGFLLSAFVLRPICRAVRNRHRAAPLRQVPSLIGLVIVFGVADAHISLWAFGLVSKLQVTNEASRFFVESTYLLRCGIYAIWVSLYAGISYFVDTNRSRLRLAQMEAQTRESELRLLRAQVNPHFLFNALNAIIAEAEHPPRVMEITHALSDYLRFSLAQTSALHPLGEELDALHSYLLVEKIRFEERFEYAVTADEAARRHEVPGALVQPLLENAVKYGQRTSKLPLRLAIEACGRPDGGLSVVVENSGSWVDPGSPGSTGLGLVNLRRRLQLTYGDAATLSVETEEHGVRVRLELPPMPAPLSA